jgi:hypothetical protein
MKNSIAKQGKSAKLYVHKSADWRTVTVREHLTKRRRRMMKKRLTLTATLSLAAATGFAQDNAPVVRENADGYPFYVGLAVDIYSAYVWRGMALNDEPVWQPNARLGFNLQDYGKVYADFWSNFDTTKRNRHLSFGGLSQINYKGGYEITLGDFSLGAGHIWFTHPKANGPDYGHSTREVFATLSYNNEFIVPFIEGYYDYDVAEGVYTILGLRKEIKVADQLSVGAEVSLGGGSHGMIEYYNEREGKMWITDGNAALFAKYDLTDNIFIGARLAWMSVVDSRLKNIHHRDNILWGGVNLGVNF